MQSSTVRPRSLNIAIVLNGIYSFLFLCLASSSPPAGRSSGWSQSVTGSILISLIGVWMMRRWAWILLLVVSALGIPMAIYGIVGSGGSDPGTYLGLVVAVYTLAILLPKAMRSRFA